MSDRTSESLKKNGRNNVEFHDCTFGDNAEVHVYQNGQKKDYDYDYTRATVPVISIHTPDKEWILSQRIRVNGLLETQPEVVSRLVDELKNRGEENSEDELAELREIKIKYEAIRHDYDRLVELVRQFNLSTAPIIGSCDETE